MKHTLFTAAAAALLLSACANNNAPNTSQNHGSSNASTAKAASSGSCRPAGSGHTHGSAQNDIYMCSAAAVLNSAEARQHLDSSVSIRYGSAGNNPLTSRQTANAVGKTPSETCERAFLNTLIQFEKAAKKRNKRNASVISYYDKKTVGGGQYECHIGTFHSKVVLRGSVY
ncbi:MAG: hypothetical protein Q4D82_01205 [Neisseria sp.]|nr:hypothetical protein [Neisseria sp.]